LRSPHGSVESCSASLVFRVLAHFVSMARVPILDHDRIMTDRREKTGKEGHEWIAPRFANA
jgi:hypothetical protein